MYASHTPHSLKHVQQLWQICCMHCLHLPMLPLPSVMHVRVYGANKPPITGCSWLRCCHVICRPLPHASLCNVPSTMHTHLTLSDCISVVRFRDCALHMPLETTCWASCASSLHVHDHCRCGAHELISRDRFINVPCEERALCLKAMSEGTGVLQEVKSQPVPTCCGPVRPMPACC